MKQGKLVVRYFSKANITYEITEKEIIGDEDIDK